MNRWNGRHHGRRCTPPSIEPASRRAPEPGIAQASSAVRRASPRAAPFGLFLAFELAEAFVDHPDPERRVRPITAANYVDALIAVGRKAGIAPVDDLDAMSVITQELRAEADAQGKLKRGRIHDS